MYLNIFGVHLKGLERGRIFLIEKFATSLFIMSLVSRVLCHETKAKA